MSLHCVCRTRGRTQNSVHCVQGPGPNRASTCRLGRADRIRRLQTDYCTARRPPCPMTSQAAADPPAGETQQVAAVTPAQAVDVAVPPTPGATDARAVTGARPRAAAVAVLRVRPASAGGATSGLGMTGLGMTGLVMTGVVMSGPGMTGVARDSPRSGTEAAATAGPVARAPLGMRGDRAGTEVLDVRAPLGMRGDRAGTEVLVARAVLVARSAVARAGARTGPRAPSTTASVAAGRGWLPSPRVCPSPGLPRASRARSSTGPSTSSCAP